MKDTIKRNWPLLGLIPMLLAGCVTAEETGDYVQKVRVGEQPPADPIKDTIQQIELSIPKGEIKEMK